MEISVFGMGYVGCVTIGCLSARGHSVIGVDVNSVKVSQVSNGFATIKETGIDQLISEGVNKGRIRATEDYEDAVLNSEASIIAVGTPSTPEGTLNLSYIYEVAEQIATTLKKKSTFHTIIVRSTVPPGTNKKLTELTSKFSGLNQNRFAIVSNPEFLREGSAVEDYYNPPLIVLASDNRLGIQACRKLYSDIDSEIIETNIAVAEMIKYVNNTFHALKVAFANEIGNICKKLSLDSHELMHIFLSDTKLNISPSYLWPGMAYGGSCLPKDLKALQSLSRKNNLTSPIIESVSLSNSEHIQKIYDLIVSKGKKKIGFYGITFKKGTDDLRDSPSLHICKKLLDLGFSVKVFDSDLKINEVIGNNKLQMLESHNYLRDNLVNKIKDLVSHSDVVIISKKGKEIVELVEKNKEILFVDLVRIKNSITSVNYEGICW